MEVARPSRVVIAALLVVLHVGAAILLSPLFWLGALGSAALIGQGRVRRVGAALLTLTASIAFGVIVLGARAATAHFGPETDAQAALSLQGALGGFAGLLLVAGVLGFAPERPFTGWARWLGVPLTLAGWAALAWFSTSAWCVHAALSPLSTMQSIRTWGPAGLAVLPLVWLLGRSGRIGWVGALALPITFFMRLSPPAGTVGDEASEAEAAAADGSDRRARDVRAGTVVSIPTAGPWRGPVGTYVVAPGRDARSGGNAAGARPARKDVVPGFAVPTLAMPPQRVTSWFVPTGEPAVPLDRDWTPAPTLTRASVSAAILAGAGFLERNQQPGGRFTYIVKGPSGEAGPGYNYPRHAGTAWFLARVAVAFDDAQAHTAAVQALLHLDEVSGHTSDGRAFVLDPTRRDGRAWIGTTALAVLAVETLEGHGASATWEGWKQQVIASVGVDGKVRGEIDVKTGEFIDDDANSYGQGQVMLALTAIARSPSADRDAAITALQRASAYVGGVGYYGLTHPLWVGDEHWMCLAAHGIHGVNARASVSGTATIDPAGPDGVCAVYATLEALGAPPAGAGLPPSAGGAGGAAEAVVARAWDSGSTLLHEASLDYGAFFLGCQYQEQDAPLLPRPDRLLGGFRDGPYDLDVQIDAVQHIGGALLGVLAVIEDEDGPGRMP